MEINDLDQLDGPSGEQLEVLADKLSITTPRQLILAERQTIVDGFGRRKIKPTLEEVAEWQDEARRRLGRAASGPTDADDQGWDQVAAFVVAFEERQGDEGPERRVAAEQAEVEPDARREDREVFDDWISATVHQWMVARVDPTVLADETLEEPAGPAGSDDAAVDEPREGPAAADEMVEPTPAPGPPTPVKQGQAVAERPRIKVLRATLSSGGGEIEVVAPDRPPPPGTRIWDRPTRLTVDFVGPSAGVVVALDLGAIGQPGQALTGALEPIEARATIDLRELGAGPYNPRLVVSAADASWLACIEELQPIEVLASGPPVDR